MRFTDRLLRRHLSEDALTRALLGGERPEHLDTCTACAERAAELQQWLGRIRVEANAAADQAFPPERLAVQQAQILRRIAQAEEPPRVLEFPASRPPIATLQPTRRVAPAWLAVAAAAGLVVGVVGGHLTAHLETAPAQAEQSAAPVDTGPVLQPADSQFDLFDPRLDLAPATLRGMDEATPSIVPAQYALR